MSTENWDHHDLYRRPAGRWSVVIVANGDEHPIMRAQNTWFECWKIWVRVRNAIRITYQNPQVSLQGQHALREVCKFELVHPCGFREPLTWLVGSAC